MSTTSRYQSEPWALIPSDPAIFNDMLERYGVKDTKVEEILSLDFEEINKEKDSPVYGMIFISKYVEDELPDNYKEACDDDTIIFTAQVVANVCGTLALLAILLNSDIEKGQILNRFSDFTRGFSSIDRGLCLGNSEEIKRIHNAYASNANHHLDLVTEELDTTSTDYVDVDTFHYITYLFKGGFIWELDGLKKYPIKLCSCQESNWLDYLKPILQKRMNSSLENEFAFNLMAVRHCSFESLMKEHDIYQGCLNRIRVYMDGQMTIEEAREEQMACLEAGKGLKGYDWMKKAWASVFRGRRDLNPLEEKTRAIYDQICQMAAIRQANELDVVRQKHDYFPFITALLKKGIQKGIIKKKVQKKSNFKKSSRKFLH